ncbi:MAG: hypothetical protein JNN04_05655 [Cyclobacteriaceae bacterium]|nr:hypothetical protein [Cyclobacteriaceae bacterium]
MKDIDRLFSDTLAEHVTPPSPEVWARVEAGLPQPGHSLAWMRWAAVLVPALVAAGLWMSAEPETTAPVAKQTVAPALQPAEPVVPAAVPATEPLAQTQVTPRKKTVTKPMIASTPVTEASPAPAVEETIAFEEITLEPVVLEEEIAVNTETPKPLVLEYTLETVATEAPDAADRNALDKVVDFARTVKHSDPIGDIRGLKDELFAFDLRKKQPKKN